ncbi:hypothetical protein BK126_04415 [Paenibacillus sp. FSL H7-0326]|uniref:XkdQ/YqbQ family protein n=1 Tax=Paenibacillus sp. FSL H7-0326 TaxID=1921144 RepID=UPI00096C02D7|nr:hypothetical protein [Paenibacillus sp. FSL H7-0326]OMC71346.1 hypothetical protein BK126_04415 [Paenibacillus sp. FSL H7-0326]
MFKLLLIKNDASRTYDITPITESITWDSNLSMMSAMEFQVIWVDMERFFPKNPCDLGDVVMLMEDDEEVYRGIIVTEGRSGRAAINYTVYDYAWYLGKSKSVYQFNKIAASDAISKILKDFGMLIGKVPSMNTPIDEIYLEKSPAEIIEDILQKHERRTGKRFNAELRKGKIYFDEIKDLVVKGTFRLADNLGNRDVMSVPLEADRTRTIESMRNRVKILIEREDSQYEIAASVQNDSLIKKFGLLEDTYKIDAEDAAKAREVARILLGRLARLQETNTLRLMGDSAVKAGRLLDVNEPITGMSGRYMIMTAKHTVSNQIHTMDLELVLPEEVK